MVILQKEFHKKVENTTNHLRAKRAATFSHIAIRVLMWCCAPGAENNIEEEEFD